MKVVELLESRKGNWQELERLCGAMEFRRKRTLGAAAVARFGALYRAACADLALADAYQLPPNTVQYLHQLVGRAHNQLYPSRTFDLRSWGRLAFYDLPQRLFRDNSLRLAFVLFWGFFLSSMLYAYYHPGFAERVAGRETVESTAQSFSEPIDGRASGTNAFMLAFYVWHNPSIGLQCFAYGLLAGVGGLFITISNAAILGSIFGHMLTVPQRDNFYHFVTAHGPFELTAIVLASAAGMRLGFSLIDTRGYTRQASVMRAMGEVVPTATLSVVLFCLAAIIESFISPSALPYWVKACVAALTSGMLAFYFLMLGFPRRSASAA